MRARVHACPSVHLCARLCACWSVHVCMCVFVCVFLCVCALLYIGMDWGGSGGVFRNLSPLQISFKSF